MTQLTTVAENITTPVASYPPEEIDDELERAL